MSSADNYRPKRAGIYYQEPRTWVGLTVVNVHAVKNASVRRAKLYSDS